MKRDMDLVRSILMVMSESSAIYKIDWAAVLPAYELHQIRHHAYLMIQGGLIEGAIRQSTTDPLPFAKPSSITWAGHEFLSVASDNGTWERAKKAIFTPAAGVTFSVALEWLKAEALKRIGL